MKLKHVKLWGEDARVSQDIISRAAATAAYLTKDLLLYRYTTGPKPKLELMADRNGGPASVTITAELDGTVKVKGNNWIHGHGPPETWINWLESSLTQMAEDRGPGRGRKGQRTEESQGGTHLLEPVQQAPLRADQGMLGQRGGNTRKG